MHEYALVKAENQDLRKANEILSRRRRAKRTRLQERGVMTVENVESNVLSTCDLEALMVLW